MSGIPSIRRAVIQTIEKKPGDDGPRYQLFVEGTGLQVMMQRSERSEPCVKITITQRLCRILLLGA